MTKSKRAPSKSLKIPTSLPDLPETLKKKLRRIADSLKTNQASPRTRRIMKALAQRKKSLKIPIFLDEMSISNPKMDKAMKSLVRDRILETETTKILPIVPMTEATAMRALLPEERKMIKIILRQRNLESLVLKDLIKTTELMQDIKKDLKILQTPAIARISTLELKKMLRTGTATTN
jgi:hypothetical protein